MCQKITLQWTTTAESHVAIVTGDMDASEFRDSRSDNQDEVEGISIIL